MAEADAGGWERGTLRDLLHVQANEVVGDGEPPHFLAEALGSTAAHRFLALESVGFDLVEAELELPALVVEFGDLRGWIGFGIE